MVAEPVITPRGLALGELASGKEVAEKFKGNKGVFSALPLRLRGKF